jgi:hypothetical protein
MMPVILKTLPDLGYSKLGRFNILTGSEGSKVVISLF